MKNNIIKKLAAVFVTAAMIGTGFSLVSAADVSDIESSLRKLLKSVKSRS